MAGLDSGFIVVGFDGTPESVGALRWALGRAAGMQVAVKIVHCWPPVPATVVGRRRQRVDAIAAVENEVTAAQSLIPQPPEVGMVFASQPVETVLSTQAVGAAMLVLGASAPRVLVDPTRGPVAGPCLDRVSCPVVLVDEHGRVATARPHRPALGLVS